MGDDDIRSVSRGHSARKLHVSDVQGVALVQAGNVELEDFRQIGGGAADFQRVVELLQHTASLHSGRLAGEVNRNMGGDFRLLIDREEIDVQSLPGERVVLDGLEESELFGAAEVEIDNDVFRGGVGQQLIEGLCVNLQVLVLGAASVDHGRDPALAAHLLEDSGTGALPGFRFKDVLLGHDEKGVRIRVPAGVFPRPGAGSLASCSGFVKILFEALVSIRKNWTADQGIIRKKRCRLRSR